MDASAGEAGVGETALGAMMEFGIIVGVGVVLFCPREASGCSLTRLTKQGRKSETRGYHGRTTKGLGIYIDTSASEQVI